MKEISLKMNDNFKIEVLSFNKMYELENNSTMLNVECKVRTDLTYKLHIEHKTDKKLSLMGIGENGLFKAITSEYITEDGSYYLQIEGIKENYRIISNTIKLEVGGFINAENIPSPETQPIIDNLLFRVSTLEDEVKEIFGDIENINKSLELKADKSEIPEVDVNRTYVDEKLALKQDKADMTNYAKVTEVESLSTQVTAISQVVADNSKEIENNSKEIEKKQNKADMANYALKTDIPTVDVNKAYVDAGLNEKQDKSAMSDYALKSEIPTVDVTKKYVDDNLATKQKILTAGENITIENDVISALTSAEMTDSTTGGVDLTVNGTTRTLAEQAELAKTQDKLDVLYKLSEGIVYDFTSDSNVGYSKTVPTGAKECAVVKFGGHSEVVDGEIVSAEVTDIMHNDTPIPIPESITSLAGYGWSAGNVYNEVDFENKKYIQRVGKVKVNDIKWARLSDISGLYRFEASYTSAPPRNRANSANILCDELEAIPYEQFKDGSISIRSNLQYFRILSATLDTSADINAQYGEATVYYELAEPIITDITDILEPFAVESGDVITFKQNNDLSLAIPSTLKYLRSLKEVSEVTVNE